MRQQVQFYRLACIFLNPEMIIKTLARVLLRLLRWEITGELPGKPHKCVVMMAPHTANIDFFYGWLGYASLGYKSYFFIKKEAFNRFTTPVLKAMGGIPVDRSHSTNVVHQLTEEFNSRKSLILTITPEGTRKRNPHWKKGYYFIARNAGVPVVMGYLDYKTKRGGFGPSFMPTGDYESDFKMIREFYGDKTARHPDRFVIP